MNKTVRVFDNLEAASRTAASIFTELAQEAIAQKGGFFTAVPGGSTPLTLFSLLGTEYKDRADWEHIHVFWADERCVPMEDEKSNFRYADDLWLSKVSLPETNVHRIRGEGNPEKEALRYEGEIRETFGVSGLPAFDLILLGMGEEGHTASLFPGSAALAETERLAVPVFAEHLQSWRITLTLPVLNNAGNVIFLVSGSAKAPVLSDILEHPEKRKRYPAGLITQAQGRVTWLIDKAASSKL